MKKFFALVPLLFLLGCSSKFETAQRATVLLESKDGFGSGFVVRRGETLFVWTCAHVVSNDDTVKVRQAFRVHNEKVGEAVFSAQVIARDESDDIALLWLKAPARFFSSVEFWESPVLPGQPVFHVGNLLGQRFENSVTAGIVSQIGVPKVGAGVYDQTDTVVVPGSSGGPVFVGFQVIGIVSRYAGPGIGFYIPAREVRHFSEAWGTRFAFEQCWFGQYVPSESELQTRADHAKELRVAAKAKDEKEALYRAW